MNRLTCLALALTAAGCATAPPGPAKVVSEPKGATAEAVIRSVDNGTQLGSWPMDPVYEVNLEPGSHHLNLLCIPKPETGAKPGNIGVDVAVEPGKAYLLTANASAKPNQVCDVSVTERK